MTVDVKPCSIIQKHQEQLKKVDKMSTKTEMEHKEVGASSW